MDQFTGKYTINNSADKSALGGESTNDGSSRGEDEGFEDGNMSS